MMNSNYKIFIDAGADLDKRFLESMGYTMGSKVFEWTGSEPDATARKIYDSQRNGELTETISLKQEDYNQKFEGIVRHGLGVLYISMSSVLSKSNYYAKETKRAMLDKYGNVPFYIVDSMSASGGVGIIIERAIYNKQRGYALEQNAEEIARLSGHVKSWFYVNDLDYLRRDGRTSASKSFVGTLLGIKPILEISSDGQLRQINKGFGKKRACEVLKDLYFSNGGSAPGTSVYITHSDDFENANLLRELVLQQNPNVNIKMQMLTPIIGAHTGPGVITIHHYNGN